MDLEGEVLDKLARANHKVFVRDMIEKGYTYGPQTDDKLKTHSSLIPYDELPEDEKAQNQGSVKDIVNKLDRVGYVMIPARSNEPPFRFPEGDIEMMAEMEHDRWMRAKLAAGWRWHTETIKEKKLHKSLLLWRPLSDEEKAKLYGPKESEAIGKRVLPEKEKDKDRKLMRAIPDILLEAGFTIVKTGQGKTAE